MFVRKFTTALAVSLAMCAVTGRAQTSSAIAPKFLVDPTKPAEVEKQITAQGNVTVKAEGGKLVYTVQPGNNDWPGAGIKSVDGKPWDLSPWGHIEAKITNTGKEKFGIGMRVDDSGSWENNNAEQAWLDPGKSATIKVIFGYQYGFQKGKDINRKSIGQVLFFLHGKGNGERTFTVEDLMANGPAGEKPPADPRFAREIVAKNANIFGKGARFDAAKQLAPKNATTELSADKSKINCTFQDNGVVQFKPFEYNWSLKNGNALAITVKNTGKTAVTPKLQAASGNDRTDLTPTDKPLNPGQTTTLIASFIPQKPWVAEVKGGGHNGIANGTGTKFDNVNANAIFLSADNGAQLEVSSLALIANVPELPKWLGKQPPVPQAELKDWKQTLNENFDKPLEPKLWNIYTDNYWDKRTHFSKDNNFVKGGELILRYTKTRGKQNDTEDKETDYASGHADTYGKWTQRYGYFEARMKLPEANGLWPAFWMMPDRGIAKGPEQWKRASTDNGGMELDIMEHLSGWGRYRFNQAFHWDGYGDKHKAVGSTWAYIEADKDDYITIGMLWLPGLIVYYSNGQELGRFENERVCDQQSNLIFYMVSGGWANTPLDDEELADPKISKDFAIDYVRVWQRNDLATPEDGPKPNDGRPKMHSQSADGN